MQVTGWTVLAAVTTALMLVASAQAQSTMTTSSSHAAPTTSTTMAPTTTAPFYQWPTSSPTPSAVNCSSYTSCSTCSQQGACGWCNAGTPMCIVSYNFAFGQGDNSAAACYGQADQFYYMQCSVGGRTLTIAGIVVGILVGMAAITLTGWLVRRSRRNAEEGSFSRMVDGISRRHGGANRNRSKRTPTA
ncbi:hypothetical protein RI367_000113 [Sorochytrium milnesiophthora]